MLRRRLMNSRKEEELSYTDKYLTIEALEDGVTVSFTNNGLEYCVDGDGNWMSLYEYEDVIIDTGHTLHFRGNLVPDEYYGVGKFLVDNEFNLKGNVMSILYGDDGYLNYSLSGKENAFYELFYLVKGLKSVSPNFLPATTLSAYCYISMFKGCTKLEKAPDLPAEELVTWCYADMFYGCTRLNYIKALFKTTPSDEYTDYWVSGVNQSGTFVKHPEATWNVVGINGVPEGWIVKFDGEEEPSFEFPLYIYSDECSSDSLSNVCFAYGDYSGLKQYLIEFVKNNGDNDGNYWWVDDVRDFGITIILDGLYYVTTMDYFEGDETVFFGHTRSEGFVGSISDTVILYEYSK